ncbi:MAG TPA: DUF748 domain-containing protein, partial [Candidatus Omnitrophota bacterium]|nr:DUF748 domain-containing protein [Candidatus Omnitrophota bacterium]
MAEDRPNFWTSRRRWAAVAVAGTLAAMAAGHWLPDAGLRWGLVKTLRDLGMSDVALGGADLSLFNGALVVRGVSAKPEGGAGLDLAGLLLDFRWKPLLSKRVSVEALELDGADIELRRTGDGWELNGLPLAGGGEGGSQWSFDADRLRLTASRLTVLDGTTRVAIDLDDLQIDNLRSWDAGQTMRYHLAGKVNGAPLVVDGSATPFADIPAFALTATAEKLDLAPFARAAGLAKLAGKLSGEIALTGKVESARIPLEADGKLSAAGMAVEIDGTRLAGDLAWTGKAHVDGAVKATGKLSADRLTVTAGGATVTAGHAVVEAAKAEWAGGKGSLDGAIAAEAAQYGDADVTVSAQALSWKGKAGLAADGAIASEGSAEATAIAIRTLGRVIEQARAGGTGSLNVVAAAKGVMPPLTGRFDAWAEGVMVREPIRDLAAAERVEAKGVAL